MKYALNQHISAVCASFRCCRGVENIVSATLKSRVCRTVPVQTSPVGVAPRGPGLRRLKQIIAKRAEREHVRRVLVLPLPIMYPSCMHLI